MIDISASLLLSVVNIPVQYNNEQRKPQSNYKHDTIWPNKKKGKNPRLVNMDEWKRPRHTKNENTVYREWWMYVFLNNMET